MFENSGSFPASNAHMETVTLTFVQGFGVNNKLKFQCYEPNKWQQ